MDTFESPVRRQVNFTDENDSMSDLSTYNEKYNSLAKQCVSNFVCKNVLLYSTLSWSRYS